MTYQARGRRSVPQFCLLGHASVRLWAVGPMVQNNLILSLLNRGENLDKFQITLLDELKKVEKDSQTLRDLEKEFVVCVSKN